MSQPQHGIRISYGIDQADHSTHIAYVPLDDADFPVAFKNAVATAAELLLRGVSHDIYPVGEPLEMARRTV